MRPHSKLKIDVNAPQAAAFCDRCNSLYRHVDLTWQFDWAGNRLINKRLLVCRRCLDVPQPNGRVPIRPGPDPVPIRDPRFWTGGITFPIESNAATSLLQAEVAAGQPNMPVDENFGGIVANIAQADFNSVADQAMTLPTWITKYFITGVLVATPSIPLTIAQGGVYTSPAKAGTAVVPATQTYAAGGVVSCSLTNAIKQTRFTASTLYLSLTVAQGVPATAAVYVVGNATLT